MRVAFDTDVIVAALRSRSGASNAILRALRLGQLEAVASVPMLLEYEAVLLRPEHRQAAGMTVDGGERLLGWFGNVTHSRAPVFSVASLFARPRR